MVVKRQLLDGSCGPQPQAGIFRDRRGFERLRDVARLAGCNAYSTCAWSGRPALPARVGSGRRPPPCGGAGAAAEEASLIGVGAFFRPEFVGGGPDEPLLGLPMLGKGRGLVG